ncbi:CHAT domain-containing protein [Irpex lacteus]|nr:CHAT domain-containing protein [Irpex lacteus]
MFLARLGFRNSTTDYDLRLWPHTSNIVLVSTGLQTLVWYWSLVPLVTMGTIGFVILVTRGDEYRSDFVEGLRTVILTGIEHRGSCKRFFRTTYPTGTPTRYCLWVVVIMAMFHQKLRWPETLCGQEGPNTTRPQWPSSPVGLTIAHFGDVSSCPIITAALGCETHGYHPPVKYSGEEASSVTEGTGPSGETSDGSPILSATPEECPLHIAYAIEGFQAYGRYMAESRLEDLELFVHAYRLAAETTPDDEPRRLAILNNLGAALSARFERLGQRADLDESIRIQQTAEPLTPDDSPDKPSRLANLAFSIWSRFNIDGNRQDLEDAISLETRALEIAPVGHEYRPRLLDSLGTSLLTKFQRTGSPVHLTKAIALLNEAIDLTPHEDPESPSPLSNLGNALHERFKMAGNIEDLEQAISLQTRSISLAPDGHPRKLLWLGNLGGRLWERFERLGNMEDVEEAIAVYERTVQLTPDGHSMKWSHLKNLGLALWTRSSRRKNREDLERAIAFQNRAIELIPEGHPAKYSAINNLGNQLQTRFQFSGVQDDLDKAIVAKFRAMELVSDEHPDKPLLLYNLSNSLQMRFEKRGDVADINDAIGYSTRSSELLPVDHPARASRIRLLGSLYSTRFTSPYSQPGDLARAVELYSEAMQHRHTSFSSISFLNVSGSVTMFMDESGRTVIWSQMLQLRTPLDDLRHLHPEIAADLQHISQALQHAATTPSSSLSQLSFTSSLPFTAPVSLDTQEKSSHSYAVEYERLISRIRELEGFEDFLRPKTLPQLASACRASPVVVINTDRSGCDALILYHPGIVKHVPLPSFSLVHAKKLCKDLWAVLTAKHLRGRSRDIRQEDDSNGDRDRGGDIAGVRKRSTDSTYKILADLWYQVVKPILDVVRTLTPNDDKGLIHITWCPTGPLSFLPLHAAGVYVPNALSTETIMDHVVSSYIPTLEAILKPRTREIPTRNYPRVLVISQPAVSGFNPIPGTRAEAQIITSLVGSSAVVLEDENGSVHAVFDGICCVRRDGLARLARDNPTNSAFILHDGKLTLSTLMSQHIPHAELAVLSACQTASGDDHLPEEAVHLAAGMLNIGYKSVIGTMWSINDSSAPVVMTRFYEVMMEQVRAGAELQPAYALHEGTKVLRERYGATDFMRWVPFVHFGL